MSNFSWRRRLVALSAAVTVAIAILAGSFGLAWAARAPAAAAAQPQVHLPYPGGPATELNRWLAAGERASQALPREHPAVLFIGDSITEWWLRYGRASWARSFIPLGAANDGVVGDTTSNVLARIDAGQLPATSPRVVVILIGTNNISLGQSPTEIAEGVRAVVEAVHARLAASRIVLLSVLPRDRAGSMARRDAAALDTELARIEGVRYVNLWPALLERTGQFRPGAMRPDLLHPDAGGYAAMTGPILAAIETA